MAAPLLVAAATCLFVECAHAIDHYAPVVALPQRATPGHNIGNIGDTIADGRARILAGQSISLSGASTLHRTLVQALSALQT